MANTLNLGEYRSVSEGVLKNELQPPLPGSYRLVKKGDKKTIHVSLVRPDQGVRLTVPNELKAPCGIAKRRCLGPTKKIRKHPFDSKAGEIPQELLLIQTNSL